MKTQARFRNFVIFINAASIATPLNPLAAVTPSDAAVVFQASSTDQELFLGRWSGMLSPTAPGSGLPIDLEISRAPTGQLVIRDLNPQATGLPLVPVTQQDADTIIAPLRGLFGPAGFRATLSADGKALLVERADGSKTGLRLTHDAQLAARLDAPRLSAGGTRDLSYRYQVPESSDLPAGTLSSVGMDQPMLERMVQAILRQEREPLYNRTDSVVILRHGKLVFEEYFWGFSRDVPHQISSDTKSIITILFGIAVDQGKVKVSDLVSSYFPEHPNSAWIKSSYPVSVHHLLSMQSGIDWNEDVPYQDIRNTTASFSQAPDPIAFVLNRPLIETPGTKYRYNSGLPTLAGEILSKVLEEPLDAFADKYLFKPLNITNYSWTRRNGRLMTAGGMSMRPLDMAKLGQMMLNGGRWGDKQIVSEQWVRQATSQQTQGADYPYGYYYHLATPATTNLGGYNGFMAVGQGGQFIAVIPELELVAVVTSSNWQPRGSRVAQKEIIEKFVIPSVKRNGH